MGLFGNAPMGGNATSGPAPPGAAGGPARPRWRLGLAAALASWGVYFAVLWPRMFFERPDGLWAGWRTVWADWVAHLAYAGVFEERAFGHWLESHPLFATQRFDYPFLADALSGLLMRAGVDRVAAFVWPSLLASLALVALLYAFYARSLGTPGRALLALTLFFTNGGLGFLLFASDLAQDPSLALLAVPPREYTWLEKQHVEWINVVTSELLPQRGMLLGLPLGLAVLLALLRHQAAGFAHATAAKLAGLGLLASVLVVTHAHSFLALAWICAWLFLFDLRHARRWLGFAAAAAVPGLALVWLSYHDVGSRGFLAWYPGWLTNPAYGAHPISFWLFLWLNWGVFLPVAALALLRLGGLRQPLWLAGATLFVAAMLLRFQPHPWDNTKLLTWAHLLLCVPVAQYLARLWARPGALGRQLAVALFCFATASGFLDVWRALGGEAVSARMWSRAELALAEDLRRVSPPDALVLASDHHHHWIHVAGRRVLLGYRGWLASYGIDYGAVLHDVEAMLRSGDPALLARYGVDFVVIGPSEREIFGAREESFAGRYAVAAEGPGTRVFDVRSAAGRNGQGEVRPAGDRDGEGDR
jgi:hypothetical protein